MRQLISKSSAIITLNGTLKTVSLAHSPVRRQFVVETRNDYDGQFATGYDSFEYGTSRRSLDVEMREAFECAIVAYELATRQATHQDMHEALFTRIAS